LLQCTVPSSYIEVLGLFPDFPSWTGLNKRLWYFLIKQAFYYPFLNKQLPILEKVTGMSAAEHFPGWHEYIADWRPTPAYPFIMCASKVLLRQVPPDFTEKHAIVGPQIIKTDDQKGSAFGGTETKAMDAFLASGPPPVYVGFGSICCHSGKWMTLLVLRALVQTGKRAILQRGWAGLGAEHIKGEADEVELQAYIDADNVLFMETCPHGVLFPKCEVIVHHGGAGTFNASLRSGRPTVILPIIVDQFNHAKLINERGVGVGMKKMLSVTPTEIADAIQKCSSSLDIINRAKELATALESEVIQAPTKLADELKKFYQEEVVTGAFKARRLEQRKKFSSKSGLVRLREGILSETRPGLFLLLSWEARLRLRRRL